MYVMRNAEVTSGSPGHADFDPMQPRHGLHAAHVHAGNIAASTQPFIKHRPAVSDRCSAKLRRALGLTLATAASFAGTRIEVMVALESGDLAALPPWPETVRVVTQLTSLAQIDPRPVLGLIHQEMARTRTAVADVVEAPVRHAEPVMGAPLPTMLQSWSSAEGREPRSAMASAAGHPSGRTGRVPPAPPPQSLDDEKETLLQRSSAYVSRSIEALKSISGTGRIVALSAVLIAAGAPSHKGVRSRLPSRLFRRRSRGCCRVRRIISSGGLHR